MTIPVQNNRITYAGDGSTVAFPYPSLFENLDDLVVYLIDTTTLVGTLFVRGVDYTVTGGSGAAGTVTTTVPPVTGKTLLIYGDPGAKQQFAMTPGGSAPAEEMVRAWDYLTLQAQRLRERLDRAVSMKDIMLPAFDTSIPVGLAAGDMLYVNPAANGFVKGPANRAGLFLAWDGSGNPMASPGPAVIGTAVSAAMQPIFQSATTALGRANMGLPTTVLSLMDPLFGAVGDGVAEDYPALIACMAALPNGGRIYVPAGKTFLISTQVAVPSNITFEGEYYQSAFKCGLASDVFFLVSGKTNVHFQGIRFIGKENTEVALSVQCIKFLNSSFCSVDRCYITGTSDGHGFNTGIRLQNSYHIDIENNYFERIYGATAGWGYGVQANTDCDRLNVNFNRFVFTQGGSYGGRHAVYLAAGTKNSQVCFNYCKYVGNEAITFNSNASDNVQTGLVIHGNVIETCNNTAILTSAGIGFTGNIRGAVITDNQILDCNSNGIYAQPSGDHAIPIDCVIKGNVVVNSQLNGIGWSGSTSLISGNFVKDSGLAADGTYAGIVVADSSTYGGVGNVIDGNFVRQPSATNLRSGIKIVSSAANNFLGVNYVVDQHYTNSRVENVSTSTIWGSFARNTQTDPDAGAPGEVRRAIQATFVNVPGATATWADTACSINLPAGDWDVSCLLNLKLNGATGIAAPLIALSQYASTTTTDQVIGDNLAYMPIPTATEIVGGAIANWRVSCPSAVTIRMKLNVTYSAGAPQYTGRISARRAPT